MHGSPSEDLVTVCMPYKHRKELCADLKAIYSAATETEAELNLELFAEKWDGRYPTISKLWREQWVNGRFEDFEWCKGIKGIPDKG